MKKIYFLLGLLMLSLAIYAAPVSREQALGEARAFLLKNVQGKSGLRLAPARTALSSAGNTEAFYIFNVGQDAGFVVVSGDDRTPSILGYADKGTFDLQTAPTSVKAFLQGYADQISQLTNAVEQSALPRRITVKRAIAPLLQTLWDQEEPYNMSCPVFLTGALSATGCVATALSQIMKYHEWPAATKAAIPAYDCKDWNVGGESKHVHVNEIPAGVKLDWSNMQLYYLGTETVEQQQAVATLMQLTGASVATDYADESNGGSSAVDAYVPEALQNYFNYSKNAIYIKRENYLMDEWNELIYDELKAKRPVLMGGQSSGGGHAFVVDGYSSDEYFHINWGWGGFCNGYFLLSVANPGSTSGAGASSTLDGYSSSQDAVIGIEPERGQAVTMSLCGMATQLVKVTEGGEVVANYYNQTHSTNTFHFGLCYVGKKGNLVPIDGYQTSAELEEGYGYTNVVFPVKNLADGTYTILPAAKLVSAQQWLSSANPSMTYVEAVVKSGEVSLKLVTPVVDLKVTAIRPQETPTAKTPLALDVDVENNGDEFYGPLYLFSTDSEGIPSIAAKLGVSLPANSTSTVTFYYRPLLAGTYKLTVSPDGLKTIGETTLNVVAASTDKAVIEVTDLSLTNAEAPGAGEYFGKAYGFLSGDIVVKNISAVDFRDQIVFYNITFDGISELGQLLNQKTSYYFEEIRVPANSEKTIHFEFPGVNLNEYQWPLILSSDGSTPLHQDQNDIVTLLPGAVVYELNGSRYGMKAESSFTVPEQAIAVNFNSADGLTGVTGSNPNVLFFFPADASAPSSMTKNVIIGTESKNIEITDGYPFATPYSFVASDIRYTRTFKPSVNFSADSGWETIALPFDVKSVEEGGKSLNWRGDNADFYLAEFCNERGQNAIFQNAETFLAATPYLIGFAAGGSEVTAVFRGQNAVIVSDFEAVLTGDNFKMQGVATKQAPSAYTLNAAGTDFVKSSESVEPFRAFFAPTVGATVKYDKVHISARDTYTAVAGVRQSASANEWYNLNGQRIQRPVYPGVYINGGRKVVVK